MRLDFLILADRAEAVGGKLYMMGGGFDRIGLMQLPGPAPFDVAVGLLVGYLETNEPRSFTLAMEDEDNNPVLGPIGFNFELGRPPGMKKAQEQRFIAVVRGPFPIPRPGGYTWVVETDGLRQAGTKFWVDQVTPLLQPPLPA